MNVTSGSIVRRPGDGDVVWLGGFSHATKLGGDETAGAVCVLECDAARDDATPWHVHHRDDETFYILDGELAFYTEDDTTTASAGSLVHLRREIPHAFVVESGRARFLVIGTPANQDVFFRAVGTTAPEAGPPDFGRMAQTALDYGVEILGPPPGRGAGS